MPLSLDNLMLKNILIFDARNDNFLCNALWLPLIKNFVIRRHIIFGDWYFKI